MLRVSVLVTSLRVAERWRASVRELTERSRAGGAQQEVMEAVFAIAGARDAVPHLQHGDLCAQAHLWLQLLNFLQSKVSRCLRCAAVKSYGPCEQDMSAPNGE